MILEWILFMAFMLHKQHSFHFERKTKLWMVYVCSSIEIHGKKRIWDERKKFTEKPIWCMQVKYFSLVENKNVVRSKTAAKKKKKQTKLDEMNNVLVPKQHLPPFLFFNLKYWIALKKQFTQLEVEVLLINWLQLFVCSTIYATYFSCLPAAWLLW